MEFPVWCAAQSALIVSLALEIPYTCRIVRHPFFGSKGNVYLCKDRHQETMCCYPTRTASAAIRHGPQVQRHG